MSLFKKILGGPKPAPPVPETTTKDVSYAHAGKLIDCAGIDWNAEGQKQFLARLAPHLSEGQQAATAIGAGTDAADCALAYALVTALVPSRIMQVGAGRTTLAIREALKARTIPAELIVVDPHPPIDIAAAVDAHLDHPVRDVPLDDFKMLRGNELLAIQTSHVWKPGNDVDYLYTRVLPHLNSGVIVGIFGVTLPREYTREQLEAGYSEQPLLQMFLTNNSRVDILYAPEAPGVEPGPGSTCLWFQYR